MRTIAAAAFAVLLASGSAWAISVQEVIELSSAKVDDEIIIAKIKADRSTFTLFAKDILDLKKAGVSDQVILAMVEAGRPPIGTPPAPAYPPESSGASDDAPRPVSRTTTYEVIVPVYRAVCYPRYTYYEPYCYPRVYYGCGPYAYGGWPFYGFSYHRHGHHSSWGVHFGW